MISFTLTNIELDQIDQKLARMPEHWDKVKGWRLWGGSLHLESGVNRRSNGQHLMIREWNMTMVEGNPIMSAIFWIDSNNEACEIFLTCAKSENEIFTRSIIMCLMNIDDPSQVNVSSFLAQNQT
jgi:hypothetical protein